MVRKHSCWSRSWSYLTLSYFSLPYSLPIYFRVGLDLENGDLRDNRAAGILEPLMSKVKSLKFATEAAITILRIDDMIKVREEKRPRDEEDECC